MSGFDWLLLLRTEDLPLFIFPFGEKGDWLPCRNGDFYFYDWWDGEPFELWSEGDLLSISADVFMSISLLFSIAIDLWWKISSIMWLDSSKFLKSERLDILESWKCISDLSLYSSWKVRLSLGPLLFEREVSCVLRSLVALSSFDSFDASRCMFVKEVSPGRPPY